MPRNALAVTPFTEESERSCHVLFHPFPLLIGIREGWDSAQLEGSLAVAAGESLEGFVAAR